MKKALINLLNRISKFLHIPADKIAHFGVNFILALTGLFRIWLAVGLCIGASIGKEYGDSKAIGNRWSFGDILADLLGMGCGIAISFGIRKIIGR